MAAGNSQLEKRLWESADQLRANSKLTSNQYFMPVLGLIFLRHAYNRYLMVEKEIVKTLPTRDGVTRPINKDDFTSKSALFLDEVSKYDYLLNLPGDQDKGAALITAMESIEKNYASLSGILPKDYQIFESGVLEKLLKIFNDDALSSASGDVFGRIYEYFLMKFAIDKAQDEGEFFTPVSLVQTIVNVIEPNHGIVFDPACGSGGMFVQSAHFIENMGLDVSRVVRFLGQEKTDDTIRLAKMNLAVHGLEGSILDGNTFYQDRHEMLGKADFVMANPPFNVDSVDAEKIRTDPRLPFGLPGVNNKGAVPNGNYLWISYFYSYLNDTGRAGFVMSSQASSGGHGEKEVRRKMIETGHVDIMISIRSNFFYTRTVPCELWFFDKGKPKDMLDKVLMIDARNIFRKYQDSRRIFEFSPEQLKNITAIVWLYRNQSDKYLSLIKEYLESVCSESILIEDQVNGFGEKINLIIELLKNFDAVLKSKDDVDSEKKQIYSDAINEIEETLKLYNADRDKLFGEVKIFNSKYNNKIPSLNKEQIKTNAEFDETAEKIKGLIKQIDLLYKLISRLIDYAEKDITAKDFDEWDGRSVAKSKKEIEALRKNSVEQLKLPVYFHRQTHWLQSRFPEAKLIDVEGLVKLVDRSQIEQNDWSLTPGRYVGVAPEEIDDDFDFEEVISELHDELDVLNDEAQELAKRIKENFITLGL